MKKFEILRYLKRFSLLIFLVSLAGAAAIYLYADGRQKYTASVIIRYTNDGISDGYTPDGSELDVNEIYSSTVISQAMDALGASGRLSTIRSNISVTPVISEDQETINEALLQKGEEVTYFPDTYKVSLVVDGEQGAGYARNMLDAIIQSYCTYYTEKYVEQKLSLNPSSGLLDNGYDYYECIRILENDTNEMQDYLLSKRGALPEFSLLPHRLHLCRPVRYLFRLQKIHHPGAVRLCAQRPAGAGRHGAAGISGQHHRNCKAERTDHHRAAGQSVEPDRPVCVQERRSAAKLLY